MPCSKCGHQLVENVKFCSECGNQAGSESIVNREKIMSNLSLPWIIAIIFPLVVLIMVVWVLFWVNIGNSNDNAAQAHVVDELWLELIEQRLDSIENRFDSIDQRIESIEQYYVQAQAPPRERPIPPPVVPVLPEVVYRPVIPRGGVLEHLVLPGQSLASIAQIYWPHNYATPEGRILTEQLVEHLATTNGISNPEFVFEGMWLEIFEHPQIEQVWAEFGSGVPATPPPSTVAWVSPMIPPGGYIEHLVEPDQNLACIALIYWPHNPTTPSGMRIRDELVAHLAATNNITNSEIILEGMWLKIFEHPQIAQIFDR